MERISSKRGTHIVRLLVLVFIGCVRHTLKQNQEFIPHTMSLGRLADERQETVPEMTSTCHDKLIVLHVRSIPTAMYHSQLEITSSYRNKLIVLHVEIY